MISLSILINSLFGDIEYGKFKVKGIFNPNGGAASNIYPSVRKEKKNQQKMDKLKRKEKKIDVKLKKEKLKQSKLETNSMKLKNEKVAKELEDEINNNVEKKANETIKKTPSIEKDVNELKEKLQITNDEVGTEFSEKKQENN
ncbi:hypothetical protein [Nicoliella lavandulae]|uniref:Uncharacterized protein n=1 Tax=Nicoliella lavandulae TaxID=3082954 RepID=A0ABU8SM85_9LACO